MNKMMTILILTVLIFSCSLLPHNERGYLTIYNPNDFDVYYDLKKTFYSGSNSNNDDEDNDFSNSFKLLKSHDSKQYYESVYSGNNQYYKYEFVYCKEPLSNMKKISAFIHYDSNIILSFTF